MPRMQMISVEELVMRSARSHLYGHPFGWDLPADRYRAVQARAPGRRRLQGLRATLGRARGDRRVAAEAGCCG